MHYILSCVLLHREKNTSKDIHRLTCRYVPMWQADNENWGAFNMWSPHFHGFIISPWDLQTYMFGFEACATLPCHILHTWQLSLFNRESLFWHPPPPKKKGGGEEWFYHVSLFLQKYVNSINVWEILYLHTYFFPPICPYNFLKVLGFAGNSLMFMLLPPFVNKHDP